MDANHLTIDHSLGRERAKDRVIKGIEALRKEAGERVSMVETWTEPYVVDVVLRFLSVEASGRAAITDTTVEADLVKLPLLLRPFRGPVESFIRKHAPPFFQKA